MPSEELCRDGIAMALESKDGHWIVLLSGEGEEIARFRAEPSELRGALEGRMTIQVSDGTGNGASLEGGAGGLKVRLEGEGHTPKVCRISREDVERLIVTLKLGVPLRS